MADSCSCKKRRCHQCNLCMECSCGCMPVDDSDLEETQNRTVSGPRKKRPRILTNLSPPVTHRRKNIDRHCSAKSILEKLGAGPDLKKLLPGPNAREKEFQSLSQNVLKNVRKLISGVSKIVLSSIFSDDETVQTFLKTTSFAMEIACGIRASKKQSTERKALMGVLCTMLSREEVCEALRELSDSDEESGVDDNELIQSIRGEISRRSTTPRYSRQEKISQVVTSGGFRKRYADPRRYWSMLISENRIPRPLICRSRIDVPNLTDVVKFILEDVQVLSWGTKRLEIVDERGNGLRRVKTIDFPGLTRKRSREEMYRGYVAWTKGSPREMDNAEIIAHPAEDATLISRSTFLKLASHLTRTQRKRKTAVDYVLGTLVYDNLALVRRVVSDIIIDKKRNAELLAGIAATEQHVKFSYLREHVGVDQDHFHDVRYALDPLLREGPAQESFCEQCMAPFQLLEETKSSCLTDAGEDADKNDINRVFVEAEKMLLLFYGHQQRVGRQQCRIAELLSEIKAEELPSPRRVMVLLDYKMKFESIRYREKSVEFFGKRGSSWHGAVVFFSDGMRGLRHIYFDHLSAGDTKQDVFAVASICDAVFYRLSVVLPSVREVYVLSDNARCYQNSILPVMLPFIVQSHNSMRLLSFLHTETQDGKSLVDAHFAVAMKCINSYITNNAKNVITPHQVVNALNSNGGLANTLAELVHIHSDNENLDRWMALKKEKKIAEFGRANEISYGEISDGKIQARVFKVSGFSYRDYLFSREGSKRISQKNSLCTEQGIFGTEIRNTEAGCVSDGTESDESVEMDVFVAKPGDSESNFAVARYDEQGLEVCENEAAKDCAVYVGSLQERSEIAEDCTERRGFDDEEPLLSGGLHGGSEMGLGFPQSSTIPVNSNVVGLMLRTEAGMQRIGKGELFMDIINPEHVRTKMHGHELPSAHVAVRKLVIYESCKQLAYPFEFYPPEETPLTLGDAAAPGIIVAWNIAMIRSRANFGHLPVSFWKSKGVSLPSDDRDTARNDSHPDTSNDADIRPRGSQAEHTPLSTEFSGIETGIVVRTSASLRFVQRKRPIDGQERLESGNDNVLADMARVVRELESDRLLLEVASSGRPPVLCSSCGSPFETKEELQAHFSACTVSRASLLTIRAATLAQSLLGDSDSRVHNISTPSPALAVFGRRVSAEVRARRARIPRWAERPPQGRGFGENTVGKYSKEVMDLYVLGVRDKAKRMNAPMMLERLRAMFPRRYDLPCEQFVIQFISAQNKRLKDLSVSNGDADELYDVQVSKRKRIPEKYAAPLTVLIKSSNLEMAPRTGYKKLIEYLNLDENDLPEDFPEKKAVTSKVSNIKSALKKAR